MQSPPLWSSLDFSHATSSLRADTLRMYLQHLGRSSLAYLSLNHHQVDGDGMLMVLAEHECRRVKSLSMYYYYKRFKILPLIPITKCSYLKYVYRLCRSK